MPTETETNYFIVNIFTYINMSGVYGQYISEYALTIKFH